MGGTIVNLSSATHYFVSLSYPSCLHVRVTRGMQWLALQSRSRSDLRMAGWTQMQSSPYSSPESTILPFHRSIDWTQRQTTSFQAGRPPLSPIDIQTGAKRHSLAMKRKSWLVQQSHDFRRMCRLKLFIIFVSWKALRTSDSLR